MGGAPLILLDTHVLIWLDIEDFRVGSAALEAIAGAEELAQVAYSATSLWEIGTLLRKRRVVLPIGLPELRDAWRSSGLVELVIDGGIALLADDLPGFHADPADRFIVATALAMDATLVTADERILAWSGPLRRLDARV